MIIKFAFLVGLLIAIVACVSSTATITNSNTNTIPMFASTISPTPKLTPDKVIPSGLKDGVAQKRRYTNYVYGYSVPVPKELVAYSSPPPLPQHGAGIIISENPDSYLYVDGSYNALFWKTLDETADAHLNWLKEDFPNTRLQKKESARLGNLPALRFAAKYDRDGVSWVNETIMAFRGNDEVNIVYTASFDTTEEQYSENVIKFEEVVNGWKLKKIE